MVTRRPGHSERVEGPHGQAVYVKFFDDGSIRFRLIGAGPMVIRFAFLPGKNVVVELTPTAGSPWLRLQN